MNDISSSSVHFMSTSIIRSDISIRAKEKFSASMNASYMLEDDPTIAQASSLFPEFKEAMKEHGSDNEIFQLLGVYESLCNDHVQLLNKLVTCSAPSNRQIKEANIQLNLLRREKETWRLLHSLYNDRVLSEHKKGNDEMEGIVSDIDCKTESQLIKRLYDMNDFVRTAQLLVDWLENVECEKLENYSAKIQYFIDNSGQAFENTLYLLKKGGKPANIVNRMDPDACFREKAKLSSLDEEDEERFLRHVFLLLRAGQLDEAQSICIKCGHAWRAATLEGWRLYHDPNIVGDNGDVEGNASRDLWSNIAWNLCETKGISSLEKAIYGSLCGHLQSILPFCQTWHDHLWARLKVAILGRVEQELYTICVTSKKSIPPPPDLIKIASTSFSQILNDVDGTEIECLRNESKEKYIVLQKMIILGDTSELLRIMAEWVDDELEDDCATQLNNHLLRFMAHLVLFLKSVTVLADAAADDDAVRILRAYVQNLIKNGPNEIVSFYIARLPVEMQADVLAVSLQSIQETDERHALICFAQTDGVDIQSATRKVVQLIRDHPKSSDKDIIKSLEWLTFDGSQQIDLIKATNSIIRIFLVKDKFDSAKEAIQVLSQNIIDNIMRDWKMQMGSIDLPPDDSNAVKELLCYKVFLDAHTSFHDWFSYFHKHKPEEIKIPVNCSYQEKINYEQLKKEYEIEYDKYKRTLEHHSKMAIDRLYNVLLFPNNWLVDEFKIINNERHQQLKNLRQLLIPNIFNLLVKIFEEMDKRKELLQLADILADEDKKLYDIFSRNDLQRMMNCFRENSLKLQLDGFDSLGY